MSADNRREAAIDYLRRGWSVIPIRPRSKLPAIPWEEYQHRRAAPAEVADWFRRWPSCNIAVVTGALSGLVVLDVDPGHGGADSLNRLEATHGRLPPTVEATTGGGGHHHYFALSGTMIRSRTGLAPGLDLRGEGGMAVAPPSGHQSGGRYRWVAGRDPASIALAPSPGWLIRDALDKREGRGHPTRYWRALVKEGVSEGTRNATLASLTGHLLWHGVDEEVVLELLAAWNRMRCRPPLEDEEVLRVVQSIARTHERRN